MYSIKNSTKRKRGNITLLSAAFINKYIDIYLHVCKYTYIQLAGSTNQSLDRLPYPPIGDKI